MSQPRDPVARFHLLAEQLDDAGRAELVDLACGDGEELLALDAGGAPRLEGAGAAGARHPLGAPRLEALELGRRSALLLHAPRGCDVRVNGRRAPLLSVLEVADQVAWDETLLHVTRTRNVRRGAPTAEQIGRRCPVCSVPVDSDTTVLACECGALLHAEPSGAKPDADLLQCAELGACPACERSLSLEPGFVYTPE